MATTTYSFAQMNLRLPSLPNDMDLLFATHFDVASAGGKLIKASPISQAFSVYIKAAVNLNRQIPTLLKSKVSDQIKSQALLYWAGRVIEGPAATTIVLFPGIWIPLGNIPNLVPGAKQWIDFLSISLYIQKNTLLGITISKAVPGLVLPWYGASFQSLDTPAGLPQLLKPMINSFNTYVDLLMSVTGGDMAVGDLLKQTYTKTLEAVFTPELYSAVGGLYSPYGINFNELNNLTAPAVNALNILSNP